MATNKEIIKKLADIEDKLPNGELEEMHEMIKEIKEEKVRIAKRFARNIVLRYVRILWGTWKVPMF